ncbi:DUF2726 domain-containing protein [Cohnella nanjingensis]|uniref:DUF2726 domain-containing protein n=1 Tax=Cohnella nanjingensis TaxID=1387779 RepID=A0A7X0RPJ3_9BACL|nr:DUF2726 domain-containing protein [Cohnella nanjingensis]MBB6670050.1 DUF2726 domain-containing protein [Cohnella nanjingensis]
MNKEIFNKYENVTYQRLNDICKAMNASVFPKVRIADVFNISQSGLTNTEYSFALKSHFDFTIYNNDRLLPLFALEFDGESHKGEVQKERDAIKNKLCLQFDLPLLRINSRYLVKKYRNYDLLSWCVDVWFSAEAFFKSQEDGIVPLDEIFDPQSIYYDSSKEDIKFPMFMSYDIRRSFRNLNEQGKLKSSSPNIWIGTDSNKNYYGLSWIYLNDSEGLLTTSGIRTQQFPISECDLLNEIMTFDLFDQYNEHQLFKIPKHEIHNKIKKYEEKYKIAFLSVG